MDSYDKETIKECGIIAVIVISLFILSTLVMIHFKAIGKVVEYQALKSLVIELKEDARTEDVLGKVADWNMEIANAKEYNKIPIIQFFVPDKIANLELIKIPKLSCILFLNNKIIK